MTSLDIWTYRIAVCGRVIMSPRTARNWALKFQNVDHNSDLEKGYSWQTVGQRDRAGGTEHGWSARHVHSFTRCCWRGRGREREKKKKRKGKNRKKKYIQLFGEFGYVLLLCPLTPPLLLTRRLQPPSPAPSCLSLLLRLSTLKRSLRGNDCIGSSMINNIASISVVCQRRFVVCLCNSNETSEERNGGNGNETIAQFLGVACFLSLIVFIRCLSFED